MADDKTDVYSVRFFFRGREIKSENEPPRDIVEEYLNYVTTGIAHPGWDIKKDDFKAHICSDNCSVEACIIWGRPYTDSVIEAFDS